MYSSSNRAIEFLLKIRDYLKENQNLLTLLAEINQNTSNKNKKPDSFRILIGTVLSVRNRDESTAFAVRRLFDEAGLNSPSKIAKANPEEIEILIRKSGMYKTKTKRIQDLSKMLLDEYNGIVPDDLENLLKLKGVGRKVANCVLVYAFNKPAIPVDVHVHRISNRMGIVTTKKPDQTEQELIKIFPKKYWTIINDSLVVFGKTVCKPISPKCSTCPILDHCPQLIIKKKRKSTKK